jgi:hypothetical protein
VLAALLIAIAIAAGLFVLRRTAGSGDVRWPLAVAAMLSLVLVPYEWPTDHVLLLCAALLAVRAADRVFGAVRAGHLGLTVLALSAMPWLLFLASAPRPTQALEALVPLITALLLVQSARLTARA